MMRSTQSSLFKPAKSDDSLLPPIDARSRYNKHQERWLEYSQSVVTEAFQLLNSPEHTKDPETFGPPSLADIYSYFAKKRAEIAKELGHGKDDPRGDLSDQYGDFREEMQMSAETVKATDEITWPHQKDEIFAQVQCMIDALKNATGTTDKYGTKYDLGDYRVFVSRRKEGYIENREGEHIHQATSYEIDFASPIKTQEIAKSFNHTQTTLKIKLRDFDEDKSKNWISIDYADINKYDKKGDEILADRYYQACLKAESTKDFMLNAGRLSHLLAQLLWVKRGNAAIVEWIINFAAKQKGIEPKPFSHDEKLSWDWKALVTPSREKYAEWYAEHAFKCVADSKSSLTIKP